MVGDHKGNHFRSDIEKCMSKNCTCNWTTLNSTLVPLMEWSHIEHMMGKISDLQHHNLYKSWQKNTNSYYESLETVTK